jgi:ribosomal protein L36
MKKVSSLKNLRKRHEDIQLVRRGKKIFLIIPGNRNARKYKAVQ